VLPGVLRVYGELSTARGDLVGQLSERAVQDKLARAQAECDS
jgi:hypothetical protein